MNINKIIWFVGLSLLNAHIAIFLTRATFIFPELKLAYILLILGASWFFKSQFNSHFRQALANVLNLDESEYAVILFCILIGLILGGAGTWSAQIL